MRRINAIWLLAPSLILLTLSGCGVKHQINATIAELRKGVDSFAKLEETLSGLAKNLNDEVYKKQVEDLINTTGQVALLKGEAAIDFTRGRVIEDLEALIAKVSRKPIPKRIPVLSSFESHVIDLMDPQRDSVTIVGWNLDEAANNADQYKILIEDDKQGTREVEPIYFGYHGQYAVSVNISSSGVPLKYGDKKMNFIGYTSPSSVLVINTDPPPKATKIRLHVGTTWDNKDKEVTFTYTIQRIADQKNIGEISVGGGEVWDDPSDQKPSWRTFEIPLAESDQFPAAERLEYRLLVHYSSSDGDPKWNGRFKADALISGEHILPVLKETADYDFGHRGDGNPDDRFFVFDTN